MSVGLLGLGAVMQVFGMELPLIFSTGTSMSLATSVPFWPAYSDELAGGYPSTNTPTLFLQGELDGQTEEQYVVVD